MFDVGWPEMLVIAIVMIVVVGPKDLPRMLRSFGKTTAKLRVMAGDFRKQFDEALKEAELDDLKTLADDARKLNPTSELKKALSPMEKAAQDVRAGLDAAMNPGKHDASGKPASTEVRAVEPAKAGTTATPGEGASAKTKANGAARPAAAKAVKAEAKAGAALPAKAAPKAATASKATKPAAKPAPAKPAPAKALAAKAKNGGAAS